jgi:hypothetical protein
MNVSIDLLFHLDIPTNYIDKLVKYYYIPENKLTELRVGGYIYLVDKYISNKKIYYSGILTKIDTKYCFKGKESVDVGDILDRYHVFYRPKINKMENIIKLMSEVE